MAMVPAMNNIDAELASFLRTVVSIETELPPVIEVLRSDVPRKKDMEYQNDPLNCIALQRVYYSSKGKRMPGAPQPTDQACECLSHDNPIMTTKGCFASNNECTSTETVHFGPPKISFPNKIYEQTSRDSFRRRKRRTVETTNAKQQGNIRLVKKQRNCKIIEAENAHYPIVSETFQDTNEKTFEERWRNANVNGYFQVEKTQTPRLCGIRSRASSSGIDSLFNSGHIRSFNEGAKLCARHDIKLQRYNQKTKEKTSREVLKGKASCVDVGPVMPRCSFSAVSYFQERHSINSHIKERMNLITLKSGCQESTTQRQTEQSYETVAAEETRKGSHAMSIREAGRVQKKLLHPVRNRHNDGTDYIMCNGNYHQGHQASIEYKLTIDKDYKAAGLGTIREGEKVPPKSNFAFSQISKSCSAVKPTEQTTTVLCRTTQYIQAFSESSPAVLRHKKKQCLTNVPHWYLTNDLVSQEDSFNVHNVQQRPPQQHVDSDREKNPSNVQRLAVSSSPDGVERSSNREISTSLQSSQDIISRRNSITPSSKMTTSSVSPKSDILHSKSGKNLALTTKRKIFMCKFHSCSRIFHTRDGLILHQSCHTGERYTCPWENCDRKFKRSDGRLRHFRKHTGEKPYECPYCTKCFSRSDHRRTHVKKMHHEEELPVCLANPLYDKCRI